MDIKVDRDLQSAVTNVEVIGVLTRGTGNDVLAQLLKCAAEFPAAVIVDVSGVVLGDDGRTGVFATAFHQVIRGHGIPILLVGARPEFAEQISRFRTFAHMYPSHADARRALRGFIPRWRQESLTPSPASAHLARGIVTDACRSWGVMHLRNRARLIISELANNAIEHTGQMFQVTVSYTGDFLRLAVQDQSLEPPRLIDPGVSGATTARSVRGRGLRFIGASATHWGTYWLPDGKVVWAMLRACAVGQANLTEHASAQVGRHRRNDGG